MKSKMGNFSSNLSIITLNVNIPIRRHTKWIKRNSKCNNTGRYRGMKKTRVKKN
jgi:hypothetical protein